jgi:rhamnulokinase
MTQYLGIDLGAESGRVMLGTLENGRLDLRELHRFPNRVSRLAGTLRWDLLALWEEIKVGLRAAAKAGAEPRSVSVDSWALDYVLMRPSEPMLRAPFCYRDARTERTYAPALKKVGAGRIYEATGLQFMPINTLYHLLAEQAEDPALLRTADRFLMIGDWFHHQLGGRAVQEESNASTTQLWDPRARAWSRELIEEFGLPADIFPEVVPPCTRLGKLSAELQRETGLGEIEIIAGCVHDTGAAVAAVPAEGEGWAYLSSGTWSLIGVELPGPLITEAGRAANFTNETGVGGTSRFLRNASGMWMLQECRRSWQSGGRDMNYSDLTRWAVEAPAFQSVLDPNHPMFLRPDDMPTAIQDFCRSSGQRVPETYGEFARCIFESLAVLYETMLASLEQVTGLKIHTLHVVGGGSRNALLNQMTANATGRTVVAGPDEATVAGNVLLQALTLGDLSSHAALREVVRNSFPVLCFAPKHEAAWDDYRARYRAVCR